MKIKPGSTIGKWSCHEQIGRGGNGTVYRVTCGCETGALKVLRDGTKSTRVVRFKDEIEAMKRCANINGVLPVLDDYSSQPETDSPPWFVMGLAEKITSALGPDCTFRSAVEAIHSVAATLTLMHATGFSHRDIKPENLFKYAGSWAVGDFGLADFESKVSDTAVGEKIGPIFYIAPEMLNQAISAQGAPADVYSLAKTFWVLATGQKYPLPGTFDIGTPALTISAYVDDVRACMLDHLLMSATAHAPLTRPTMLQFASELKAWLAPQPIPPTTNSMDLTRYAAEFSAMKQRHEAAMLKKQESDASRSEAGRRIRERFRPFTDAALRSFIDANFVDPWRQIDNYHYGFELSATVPPKPWIETKKFVSLKLECQINDNAFPGTFNVFCACTATAFNGNHKRESLLWRDSSSFLQGGAQEQTEIQRLVSIMRSDFQTWVSRAVEMNLHL
jgi:serine/threonine protein kinase